MSDGRAELLQVAPRQHRDAVRHAQRLLLVVGDQHGGDAELALQALDLDLHVEPQVLVERAERLVQQQDARPDRQAPRQRHALLLPARELPRQAVREGGHAHRVQHGRHRRRHVRPAAPGGERAVGDVLRHRHVREQRVVLEHDADLPRVRRQAVMLRPPTSTSPAIGRWNPATIFSSVVLPQPLGPSSDTSSPGRISSVMSLAAVTAPNRCVMLLQRQGVAAAASGCWTSRVGHRTLPTCRR